MCGYIFISVDDEEKYKIAEEYLSKNIFAT
jgi:hypothetical protein